MKVKFQGKAKKHWGDFSGVYILQPQLVNGYPTWKSKLYKNSLWFGILIARWVIGLTSDLGTKRGAILGPKTEDDWPQNLSGWQYGDGTGTWPDAGSDLVIEDYSDGKSEIHFNYA